LILECIMLYIIYYVCVCVRVRVRVRVTFRTWAASA